MEKKTAHSDWSGPLWRISISGSRRLRLSVANDYAAQTKSATQAKSISDIEPPGGIIGITASSLGITTSMSTGPGVAKASAMMRERSFDFSMRKPLAPYASASLTKFGTDIAE